MERNELMHLLEIKGLLSEEDSFTLVSGREAAVVPVTMAHVLVVKDCLPEEGKTLTARLLAVYEEESPLIVMNHGDILRLRLKEMEIRKPGDRETILFDSRKAKERALSSYDLGSLEHTVHRLLAPGGCPWDRSQTHETLRTYFIQEVYEVIDAIDRKDMDNLKEELGDVLFQIIFHAALAEKEGYFSMQDVADGVRDKMVRRHPFVFDKNGGDSTISAPREWEKRKRIEKNRKYLLSGVPKGLPSLLLTCIIQKKVSSNGLQDLLFPEDLPVDLKQQISRFLEDDREMDREKKAGIFLFALVHYLQEKGIEPELALHRSDTDFMSRLRSFEDFVMQKGKELSDMSPEETLRLWKDFIAEKPSHWS